MTHMIELSTQTRNYYAPSWLTIYITLRHSTSPITSLCLDHRFGPTFMYLSTMCWSKDMAGVIAFQMHLNLQQISLQKKLKDTWRNMGSNWQISVCPKHISMGMKSIINNNAGFMTKSVWQHMPMQLPIVSILNRNKSTITFWQPSLHMLAF